MKTSILCRYSYFPKIEDKIENYLPEKEVVKILITSGASCPDAVVEDVIKRLLSFYSKENELQQKIDDFNEA